MSTGPDISPIDPESLERLAIFPLPGMVLFPGAVLPLHIFEPRYREMTRDALAGSGLIAMVRIRDDDRGDTPAVHEIAGVGRIQAASELDDGRYMILLRGVGRVVIADELPATTSYRQVRAELLPDSETTSPELARATEAQLIQMCDQLAASIDEADELRELVRLGESPGERADLIAAALVRDADARQALLETLDPGERLDRLLELIAEAMAEVGIERQLN